MYVFATSNLFTSSILAIFYPPLTYILGCVWLCLQAQEGNIYFTELAERVEYGKYVFDSSSLVLEPGRGDRLI